MRLLILTVMLGACATGSTYRSGVGDKLLEHPPYYAGSTPAADTSRIAHLLVGYQRGSTQAPIFEPKSDAGTPIAAFLADLTAYLDSLGITTRLANPPVRGTPPDVRFSCEGETVASQDKCTTSDGAQGSNDIVMRLAVGRPSSDWVASVAAAMDSARASSLLVITLEIGQYRVRHHGLLGDKALELGTGYVVQLPWLTSLETPVLVLQLTGARIGRDGRAQRIGAEGILARRTSLPISAIGGQALIADAEVEQARTARREDLQGRPLVWQVALRNLVRGLSGR
jgi:hypothetical protein